MKSLSMLGTIDQGVHDDLRIVDHLVRVLGSTLDVREIATRTLPILTADLGYEQATFVVLDELAHELEVVGSTREDFERIHRWPLERELAARLRGPEPFVRIEPDFLPPSMRAEGGRVAFRLVDGKATVGLVLIPDSHVVESGDEREIMLVRTVGGLIGSIVSRALVHASLIRVTDRLDSARRLQQHVLDHVSHEFNTPLMILKNAAEFVDTDDAEERAAFLDMHGQALERLEGLVQGVLEVARSRSEGNWHHMNAAELRQAVIDPVLERDAWREESLRVSFDLPPETTFHIDADGLSLALEHLLRNAWSFAVERGGRAWLRIHLDHNGRADDDQRFERTLVGLASDVESPETVENANRLVIEVVDDGIGIPEDELEFVFEPFAQARNSPLRGVSGAGMGLPVCRKRVESMGGEVRLASELGRGTVVGLWIPIH